MGRKGARDGENRAVVAALALTLAATLVSAVVGCAAPPPKFVAADRATFGVIAPEYRAYVESDRMLTAEQIDRRVRLLRTWALRLEAAEAWRDAGATETEGISRE